MFFETALNVLVGFLPAIVLTLVICLVIVWQTKKAGQERFFRSFLGVEPPNYHRRKYFRSFFRVKPTTKDYKMVAFMQPRVDAVMINLAKDVQRAIDEEENFLKSKEKNSFDSVIFETEESKKNLCRYQNICRAIERTKKIFWKLHKIVKYYGFATKDGFKNYLPSEPKK